MTTSSVLWLTTFSITTSAFGSPPGPRRLQQAPRPATRAPARARRFHGVANRVILAPPCRGVRLSDNAQAGRRQGGANNPYRRRIVTPPLTVVTRSGAPPSPSFV